MTHIFPLTIFFLNQRKAIWASPLHLSAQPAHESGPVRVTCFVSRAGNSKGKGKIIKQAVFRSFHTLTLIMIPRVCRVWLLFLSMKSKDWREKFTKFRSRPSVLMNRLGIQIPNDFNGEILHLSRTFAMFPPSLTKHCIRGGKKDLGVSVFVKTPGSWLATPQGWEMTHSLTASQKMSSWACLGRTHWAESPVVAHHPNILFIDQHKGASLDQTRPPSDRFKGTRGPWGAVWWMQAGWGGRWVCCMKEWRGGGGSGSIINVF